MKIILSRKGFDCSNGSIASPIMPDGTLVPFHIPKKSDDPETDMALYSSLALNGISYGKLIGDLSHGKYGPDSRCHVDPDLDGSRHAAPPDGWKPAFGQIGQPQRYLKTTVGIEPGDLFVFFGTYHKVILDNGSYRFIKKTDSSDFYDCHDLHLIWGYLQIGEILEDKEKIEEYNWHPHGVGPRLKKMTNALYLPTKHLTFAPNMPGCGILPYAKGRVLTLEGCTKATWIRDPVYDVNAIVQKNRKNSSSNPSGLYYQGIWQELGLISSTQSEEWAKKMITMEADHGK